MKPQVRCSLVTKDGQVSYEGSAATADDAQTKALKVAQRADPKAKLEDFDAKFIQFGTPLPPSEEGEADE